MILKQKRLEPLRFKPLAEDLGRSSDLLLNFGGVASIEFNTQLIEIYKIILSLIQNHTKYHTTLCFLIVYSSSFSIDEVKLILYIKKQPYRLFYR